MSAFEGGNSYLKRQLTRYGGWLFVLPALIAFVFVIVIPFFIGLYYSFTNWNAVGARPEWVGLANYITLFRETPSFGYSIIITLVFTLFNVVMINIFAFSLAMLVTMKFKFASLYRLGFFLPNLIGGLILGYIWRFLFNYALNGVGEAVGWNWLGGFLMLAQRDTALLAISVTWGWQYAGYIMMIYVTAIQGIPQDLINAAQIDGANGWQRLKNIVFPMVAPAFTVTVFLTLVNSLKQFDVNYSLTSGGPATFFNQRPIWGTKLIAMEIYDTYSTGRQPALAQSMAIIFFITIAIVSIIQVRYNKKREIEA